jgi:hypothetical protein
MRPAPDDYQSLSLPGGAGFSIGPAQWFDSGSTAARKIISFSPATR